MQGTRRIPSLGDHVSSWCHKNRHVAHKSANRSHKEQFPPWFHQRKWHCAKQKRQEGSERDVSSARIAHRFRPLVFTNYEISYQVFPCNTPEEYLLVAQKDAEKRSGIIGIL